MIHLFWVVPLIIMIGVTFFTAKNAEDIWAGVAVGVVSFLFSIMISTATIGIIRDFAYLSKVEFIELEEVPYTVKVTQPEEGWIKELFDLKARYDFIEVEEK